MWWDGVVGLLDIGVTEPFCCFMCFLAVWCQLRSAAATLSLKIVGFMVEPIFSLHKKTVESNFYDFCPSFAISESLNISMNMVELILPALQGHKVGE